MRRKLFNLAAALSLVLCVTVCVLWVRSYWHEDSALHFNRHGGWLRVVSHNGTIGAHSHEMTLGGGSGYSFHDGWWAQVFRFSVFVQKGRTTTSVTFPHWLACLIFGMPAAAVAVRLLRPRQITGHCQKCGYDLRATPDRCPECGAEAKPQPAEGAAA